MKTHIWNCASIWPGKVNFIDSNNVILGYDLSQSCCEHAFWSINTNADGSGQELFRGDDSAPQEIVLDNYVFDPDFYISESPDGESGIAIFRLKAWKMEDLFIRLENHHNGYYSHGFTFRSGAQNIDSSL